MQRTTAHNNIRTRKRMEYMEIMTRVTVVQSSHLSPVPGTKIKYSWSKKRSLAILVRTLSLVPQWIWAEHSCTHVCNTVISPLPWTVEVLIQEYKLSLCLNITSNFLRIRGCGCYALGLVGNSTTECVLMDHLQLYHVCVAGKAANTTVSHLFMFSQLCDVIFPEIECQTK